jgi:competence protein ComEA
MKSAVKNYLSISKKEWNGMLVMLIMMIGVASFPYIYNYFEAEDEQISFEEFDKAYAKLIEAEEDSAFYTKKVLAGRASEEEDEDPVPIHLRRFNPNQLAEAAWKELGLSPKQIRMIKNYEAKGGRFYKKDDLKKIYAISEADFIRLAPYINIPVEKKATSIVFKDVVKEEKVRSVKLVEINRADSLQLQELKGIGPAFAKRIIKYREKLGGFVKNEQLLEVYGIDSVKFNGLQAQLKIDTAALQKIPINQVGFDGLKRFPYLTFKQMNALIQYRNNHGKYKHMEDLRKVMVLNEEILVKIEPYLDFND